MQLNGGTDYKIFLADNNSDNDEGQILESLYQSNAKIKLLRYDENHGFTRGTNLMIEEVLAKHEHEIEYIALLNNDTVVVTDWLERLLKAARKENAGIVASKMINYFNHNELDNLGHRMINTGEIVPIAHREDPSEHSTLIDNFGSCAGATLYEVAMLKKIGSFDEYFNTGYEDAELGARAIVTGYKSITAPDAIVYHKISQSVSKIFDFEYVLQIQKSIFYTYFKLMPWPVLLINLPSWIVKYSLLFIFDIVSLRPKYLKMLLATFKATFSTDRKLIKKSRKIFLDQNKLISSFDILRKQEFFLWFDVKRFYKFVIKRDRKSELDKM